MNIVETYNHDSKIGVLVELTTPSKDQSICLTLQSIAQNIAMHIAAFSPKSISSTDLDSIFFESELKYGKKYSLEKEQHEREEFLKNFKKKIYKEHCLMLQPFLKDPELSVESYINQKAKEINSSITVVRFERYAAKDT